MLKGRRRWLLTVYAAIAVTAVLLAVRAVSHPLVGDEVRYAYRFDVTGYDYFDTHDMVAVSGLDDVASSQANHYMHINGRVWVHAAEQTLTALCAPWVFGCVNALVFAGAVLLLARLAGGRRGRRNAWMLVLSLGALLYALPVPNRLLISPNLAPNYLWPTALMLLFIIQWRGRRVRWWGVVCAFLLGSSNEGFAMPMSGATGLWLLWALIRCRPQGAGRWWLAIAMWAGTLTVLGSPGSWHRAGQVTDMWGSYVAVLSHLKVLMAAGAIFIVALCVAPRRLWRFVKRHPLVWMALLLSLLVAIPAHTASRGMTVTEVLCLVLLLTALRPWCLRARNTWIAAAVAVLIAAHQTWIAAAQLKADTNVQRSLRDGRYQQLVLNPAVAPFVYQLPAEDGSSRYEWRTLRLYYKDEHS